MWDCLLKLNFDDYVRDNTSPVLGFIIRHNLANHIVVATKNLIAEIMAGSWSSIISTTKSMSKEIQK